MQFISRYFVLGYGLTFPQSSLACPFCATQTAEEVRSQLLVTTSAPVPMLAVLLPFLMVGGIVYCIGRSGFDKKKTQDEL